MKIFPTAALLGLAALLTVACHDDSATDYGDFPNGETPVNGIVGYEGTPLNVIAPQEFAEDSVQTADMAFGRSLADDYHDGVETYNSRMAPERFNLARALSDGDHAAARVSAARIRGGERAAAVVEHENEVHEARVAAARQARARMASPAAGSAATTSESFDPADLELIDRPLPVLMPNEYSPDGPEGWEPLKAVRKRHSDLGPTTRAGGPDPLLYNPAGYDAAALARARAEGASESAIEKMTRSIDVDSVSCVFLIGDTIGIYEIAPNGEVLRSNVRYQFNGTTWLSTEPINYRMDHRYFAYHPYRTDAQMAELGFQPTHAPEVTDSAYSVFFRPLREAWTVYDDQSDYDYYRLSDLLGCEGHFDGARMDFPMRHLMGMLILHFGTLRLYLDDTGNGFNAYFWGDTVTTTTRDPYHQLQIFGYHRRIMKPHREVVLQASDLQWTLTYYADRTPTPGYYQHYDIGHNEHNANRYWAIFPGLLGDFLLADGKFVHAQNAEQRCRFGSQVIGMVVIAEGIHHTLWDLMLRTLPEAPMVQYWQERLNTYGYSDSGFPISLYEDVPYPGHESQGAWDDLRSMKRTRVLIMSLTDHLIQAGGGVACPADWWAGATWGHALQHDPNSPTNWNEYHVTSRRHTWYPEMRDLGYGNPHMYEVCDAILCPDSIEYEDHWFPSSDWFIGTSGQYQRALCFGHWVSLYNCEQPDEWPANCNVFSYTNYGGGLNSAWVTGDWPLTKICNGSGLATTFLNEHEKVRYSYQDYEGKTQYVYHMYWVAGGKTDETLYSLYHNFEHINESFARLTCVTTEPVNKRTWITTTRYNDYSYYWHDEADPANEYSYTVRWYKAHPWTDLITVSPGSSGVRGATMYFDHKPSGEEAWCRPLLAI